MHTPRFRAALSSLFLLSLGCVAVGESATEPPSDAAEAGEIAEADAAEAPAAAPLRRVIDGEALAASEARTPSDRLCARGPAPKDAVEIDPRQDPGSGQVRVQQGDKVLAMPLAKTRFDTLVVGTVAETTVTQIFQNPFDEALEAIYTFPLADDGAVDDYAITIGGRTIRGLMKERGEARRDYDAALAEGRTAGLLEQERPNIFTQRLGNIPAGAAIEVTIHVVQPVHQDHGRMELALPTVVGPRYSPAGTADADRLSPPIAPHGTVACSDLEIVVDVDPGMKIGDLASKFHAVAVDRQEESALVELANAGERLDRDFVLSWTLAGAAPQASLIAQRDRSGEGGHFTLTIVPPEIVDKDKVRGRELVFVIDSSGSMRGAPLEAAKAAVNRALETMGPDDTFQILNFSSGVSALGPAPIANTAANQAAARAYLEQVVSMGGTEMLSGIRAALDMPHQDARMRMVLFLTDGYIGNEQEIFAAVSSNIAGARLFSLGVGRSVNRFLLEGMASYGRGAVTYMAPEEAPKEIVDRFYERIDRPVLTDISIDWGSAAVDSVLPGKLPDLFAGQPVVVYGHYSGTPSGVVHLEGTVAGQRVRIPVKIDFSAATQASGLSSMWARKQIDDWLGPYRFRTGKDYAREKVIALAIERHVMTEYTAFIAVDDKQVVEADGTRRTVQVPVELPSGLSLSGTGRGGGGYGEGTIGLGNTGMIGKGGGGGTGSGYGTGAGVGFGGRGSRVPTVRQAKPEVSGAIDRDVVRRIVRAHINEVRACYNLGLAKDPNLKGRVVIKWEISEKGKVSAVEVTGSIGDAAVDACMVKAVSAWAFPTHPAGGNITITYPFIFEPG